MRTPTEFELQHAVVYDPVKAHEYYERTKKLKGRRRRRSDPPIQVVRRSATRPVQVGRRPPGQESRDAKIRQRQELKTRIQSLERKLKLLEIKIQEREHEEAREDRKGTAKKERARKEREKPTTAAEKAKKARESEKYRKKHRQELKSKRDSGKSGGGSTDKKTAGAKTESASQLKVLATKVKGQIAVAKQKLAAL